MHKEIENLYKISGISIFITLLKINIKVGHKYYDLGKSSNRKEELNSEVVVFGRYPMIVLLTEESISSTKIDSSSVFLYIERFCLEIKLFFSV